MNSIFPLFYKNIFGKRLVKDSDTVILGFSGGKDSTTLLLLLKKLKEKIDFNLIAAYLNHNIREDSKEEEEYVKRFCEKNGINLITENRDISGFAKKKGLNLEAAASVARYDFFKRLSSEHENPVIATAHSASDLTETFIMKLLRGSGLTGLSSIYEKKGTNIIRPLLIFSEQDILDFLKRNGIGYYYDSSNSDMDFLRNRIRKIIVPELKKIEPKLDNRISVTSELLREENDFFVRSARNFLSKNLILKKILPLGPLNLKHVALRKHILREYIKIQKGNLFNIGFNHIELLLKNIYSDSNISLPGIEFNLNRGFLYPRDMRIPEYKYKVKEPCKIYIEEIHRELIFSIEDFFQKPESNNTVSILFEDISFPLTVRSPKTTDRYKKINSEFTQPVPEIISELGLPPGLKNLIPMVTTSDDDIIWIPGAPISDDFKIESRDKKKKTLKIDLI